MDSSEVVLEAVHVSKYYQREGHRVDALRAASMQVCRRDIFGIIGMSGAGKTTLLRCLSSLLPPSEGQVLFHGQDIAAIGPKELHTYRKKIGMVFQHFNLLSSRTAAENISYPLEIAETPREEREKRIIELLQIVGLSDKKDRYPAQLSGGEKQRIGIARALATQPEIVFCDEATSALDPKTTREILALLKRVNQQLGVTIVLITHEMEVIKRICNKVAVMEGGKIIEEGSTAAIFAEPKHAITQHFVQTSSHEIPREFFKKISPNCRLLRLRFKGKTAGEPIIAHLVKEWSVDANILLGWIDQVQEVTIGTLIIELMGSSEGIENAIRYLEKQSVECEPLKIME